MKLKQHGTKVSFHSNEGLTKFVPLNIFRSMADTVCVAVHIYSIRN